MFRCKCLLFIKMSIRCVYQWWWSRFISWSSISFCHHNLNLITSTIIFLLLYSSSFCLFFLLFISSVSQSSYLEIHQKQTNKTSHWSIIIDHHYSRSVTFLKPEIKRQSSSLDLFNLQTSSPSPTDQVVSNFIRPLTRSVSASQIRSSLLSIKPPPSPSMKATLARPSLSDSSVALPASGSSHHATSALRQALGLSSRPRGWTVGAVLDRRASAPVPWQERIKTLVTRTVPLIKPCLWVWCWFVSLLERKNMLKRSRALTCVFFFLFLKKKKTLGIGKGGGRGSRRRRRRRTCQER